MALGLRMPSLPPPQQVPARSERLEYVADCLGRRRRRAVQHDAHRRDDCRRRRRPRHVALLLYVPAAVSAVPWAPAAPGARAAGGRGAAPIWENRSIFGSGTRAKAPACAASHRAGPYAAIDSPASIAGGRSPAAMCPSAAMTRRPPVGRQAAPGAEGGAGPLPGYAARRAAYARPAAMRSPAAASRSIRSSMYPAQWARNDSTFGSFSPSDSPCTSLFLSA